MRDFYSDVPLVKGVMPQDFLMWALNPPRFGAFLMCRFYTRQEELWGFPSVGV